VKWRSLYNNLVIKLSVIDFGSISDEFLAVYFRPHSSHSNQDIYQNSFL